MDAGRQSDARGIHSLFCGPHARATRSVKAPSTFFKYFVPVAVIKLFGVTTMSSSHLGLKEAIRIVGTQ